MSTTNTPNTAAAVTAFQKILNQPKMQRSNRTPADIQDGIKRLRRLILVEGIPSEAVRHYLFLNILKTTAK